MIKDGERGRRTPYSLFPGLDRTDVRSLRFTIMEDGRVAAMILKDDPIADPETDGFLVQLAGRGAYCFLEREEFREWIDAVAQWEREEP